MILDEIRGNPGRLDHIDIFVMECYLNGVDYLDTYLCDLEYIINEIQKIRPHIDNYKNISLIPVNGGYMICKEREWL